VMTISSEGFGDCVGTSMLDWVGTGDGNDSGIGAGWSTGVAAAGAGGGCVFCGDAAQG